MDIVLGLNLDGENVVFPLQDEVNLVAGVEARPVARHDLELAGQRLQHKVFRQGALELTEQAVSFGKDGGGKLSLTSQQADVRSVNLECAQVVVGREWQSGRSDTRHFSKSKTCAQASPSMPAIYAKSDVA